MGTKGVAVIGENIVDFDRMEIRRNGSTIAATSLEFRLLKFFVDNPEYVFSREQLIQAVWPERKRVNGRTVDNYISHLRQKLEDDPAAPVFFQTVYGTGYKFVPSTASNKAVEAMTAAAPEATHTDAAYGSSSAPDSSMAIPPKSSETSIRR